MNELTRPREFSRETQAAEGLLRWRWTVAEIEAMVEAGIIAEDDRFELIGGEIVPMSPKGIQHETLKAALNHYWVRRLPNEFRLIPETTFHLSEDTFVEPDFVFYRVADGLANLSPRTALLAVEVADSSLYYDLKRKARLYATWGIREVWVIDALKRVTHIHARPGLDGYSDLRQVGEDEPLPLPFAPDVAVALSKLDPV